MRRRLAARLPPLSPGACAAAAAGAAAAAAALTSSSLCEGSSSAAAAAPVSATAGRWAWPVGVSASARPRPLLLGFGNPTVDVTVTLSASELDALGLRPGSEAAGESQETKQRIVAAALAFPDAQKETTPGGAALNAMRVAAWARPTDSALRVAFLGSVGVDAHAGVLRNAMNEVGVEPLLLADAAVPTGLCAAVRFHCIALFFPIVFHRFSLYFTVFFSWSSRRRGTARWRWCGGRRPA